MREKGGGEGDGASCFTHVEAHLNVMHVWKVRMKALVKHFFVNVSEAVETGKVFPGFGLISDLRERPGDTCPAMKSVPEPGEANFRHHIKCGLQQLESSNPMFSRRGSNFLQLTDLSSL